jgi:hypothetical protein
LCLCRLGDGDVPRPRDSARGRAYRAGHSSRVAWSPSQAPSDRAVGRDLPFPQGPRPRPRQLGLERALQRARAMRDRRLRVVPHPSEVLVDDAMEAAAGLIGDHDRGPALIFFLVSLSDLCENRTVHS